ncbi:MAG: GNAT family N-acetyltransferase [Pseudomonadota bacterium]
MNYRKAEPADVADVAQLATAAGGGLFEYCLGGAPTNETAEGVGLLISALEDGFSMANAIVVTDEDDSGKEAIAGTMIAYPATEFAGEETFSSFIQPELLDPVRGLFEPPSTDSYYIHSLAVRSEFARRGIASSLIEFAEDTARGLGLPEVSLHVWADNHGAVAMYNGHGYITQKVIPADVGEKLPHVGGMLLVSKTLD